jgi:serine/threonine protein kinase
VSARGGGRVVSATLNSYDFFVIKRSCARVLRVTKGERRISHGSTTREPENILHVAAATSATQTRNESSDARHARVTRELHAAELVSTRAIAVRVSPEPIGAGRYRLLCEVGQGGMASVHLALLSGDAGFHKLVALKRPKSGLCSDPEFLEMFMNEARLAARLNHPNVVQTYEVGHYEGEPFIAMEFLEGQPLHRLQRAAPSGIPLAIHLRIIAEALAGLHHAHELREFSGAPLSVVHRDVSPQNVLVGYDGQAKVVDFGIAKAATHASYTGLGLVKGKLHYMSPEQTLGEPLDRRADLFAVGVMLWEAGSGKRLWPEQAARSRLRMLSLGEIPAMRAANPEVPAELERICRRALEYSPARRYQSAAELEADLSVLRGEPGLHATRLDVAAFMQAHFEPQRKRTQQLIEAELGHVNLNDGAAPARVHAESEREAALGTRRVPAPLPSFSTPESPEESLSSIAPALATTNGKMPPLRASRRWLGLGFAGLALAPLLALLCYARLSANAPAQPALVTSAALNSLTPAPALAAGAATTIAGPAWAASPIPPTPKKKLGKKSAPSSASASPAPAPAEPPAPEALESGLELSRERPRARRITRALDTSDPWSN